MIGSNVLNAPNLAEIRRECKFGVREFIPAFLPPRSGFSLFSKRALIFADSLRNGTMDWRDSLWFLTGRIDIRG